MPDIELASIAADAQDTVDAYCNMPIVPADSSFLGGTVTETHAWPFPDSVLTAGKRRLYPYHWPINSISAFSIKVGEGAAAAIGPENLVINNTERWVEVTALFIASNSGLFSPSGWIVPIGGLTVPLAEITLDYGYDLTATDVRCYAADDTNKVFWAPNGHWMDLPAAEVAVDGTPETPTIDKLEGKITFSSAQTGRVTASYHYRLPRSIVTATGMVVAYLLGESNLRAKDMQGLSSIRDDTIEITRPTRRPGVIDLAAEVPAAALLLDGFKHWRMA